MSFIPANPITEIPTDNTRAISTTTYTVLRSFIYRGKLNTSQLNEIKAIYRLDPTGTGTGKIRLYDSTNAKVIAEATGLAGTINTLVDLGTITNLPDSEAIFEIQIAVSATTQTIYSDGLTFYGGI